MAKKSDDVKTIQERLAKLGYMASEDATGYYGDKTLAAVKRFQERNGLIADGSIGPETKAKILSSDALANAWVLGTSGDEVQKIQDRLVELKYMSKSTGYFGSDTEKAVKAFQSRNGLTADGRVGAQTSSVLFSSDAKKAASSSGGSTSKPSGGGSTSSRIMAALLNRRAETKRRIRRMQRVSRSLSRWPKNNLASAMC